MSTPRTGRLWLRRIGGAAAVAVALVWLALRFVEVPEAVLRRPPASLEFTDRNGVTLRESRVEERFRRDVTYAEIPPVLVHAMLAAEDRRFFSHSGVDWLAAARAVASSVLPNRKTSGASTISQQLIKISIPRQRTLWTKLLEMVTALRLEQCWTKQEILAAYLSRVDFGNINFGVAQAAHYYFGKPLGDLSPAEAALLVGLPWNPTRLNPHLHPEAAKRRQETVLRRMLESGWLSAADFERAIREPLRFQDARRAFRAPHFVDLLLPRVRSEARTGVVRTTLDLDLHRFIAQNVSAHLAGLRSQNVQNAAVVVLENVSGEVLALVGSENYFAPGCGMVNGAVQPRSAGSTLKPVTYLLSLERGSTPASIVADVPTEFPTSTGPYRPENFHRHCQGPVRYREALACSLNIPAVRVLQSLGGAEALQKRLQAWGVGTLRAPAHEYGLGLTIGNAEVRLLELANVYATLARMGRWLPYKLTLDPAVGSSASPAASLEELSPKAEALYWLIADILSDNSARTPAFGANSPLRFDFPVAAKTGTSTDFRDNWAVAYTPEFTVGVWVGNFNGSPMHEVSGVTGAAPILHDVMVHLHRRFGTTWFPKPAQIVEHEVHALTGRRLGRTRSGGVTEKFLAENPPEEERPGDFDGEGRVRLGAEYASWISGGDNQISERVVLDGQTGLRLVYPLEGTAFMIDPDVPSTGWIPLLARGSGGRVVWESPTLSVQERAGRSFALALEGRHQITARDEATGESVSTWVTVKAL